MLNRVGGRLIEERKRLVLGESAGGKVTKDDVQGKDVLSILVRANLATDIPEQSRLSDADMLARAYHGLKLLSAYSSLLSEIPTLLVAVSFVLLQSVKSGH